MQFSKLFPDEKICLPQGDAHWFQCGVPCHDQVYPTEEMLRNMAANIKDTRIPTELIPRCPKCRGEMEPWIRSFVFLEGEFWEKGMERYEKFLIDNSDKKVLFIELGVGPMTPNIIKYPFSQMTYSRPDAFLVRINKGEAATPEMIKNKAITMNADIAQVLRDLVSHMQGMNSLEDGESAQGREVS